MQSLCQQTANLDTHIILKKMKLPDCLDDPRSDCIQNIEFVHKFETVHMDVWKRADGELCRTRFLPEPVRRLSEAPKLNSPLRSRASPLRGAEAELLGRISMFVDPVGPSLRVG